MPTVYIPPLLRDLAAGVEQAETTGATVRQVLNSLEAQFPGIRERLCEGEALRPGISVAVNGSVSSQGLLQKVPEGAEVHFLPALGGG